MALQKAIELPSGVVVTYHRIVDTRVDWAAGQADVTVYSYLDAEARASKQQVMVYDFHFLPGEIVLTDDAGLRSQIYVALKNPGLLFEDAVDV